MDGYQAEVHPLVQLPVLHGVARPQPEHREGEGAAGVADAFALHPRAHVEVQIPLEPVAGGVDRVQAGKVASMVTPRTLGHETVPGHGG